MHDNKLDIESVDEAAHADNENIDGRIPVVSVSIFPGTDIGVKIPEFDVQFIVDNMRDLERHEQSELGVPHGVYELEAAKASKVVALAYYKGKPAFMCGALPTYPGVVSVWGYGTNHANKVLPAIAELTSTTLRSIVFDGLNVRRAEVYIPLDAKTFPNIRWLESLGFVAEGSSRCATISNGPAITLAYTNKDHQEYVSQRSETGRPEGPGTTHH
jgi:hypothetical protein